VRRLAEDGLGAGERASRVEQLFRGQRGAAALALVAVGVLVAARGARPAYEAVGEEEPRLGIEELLLGPLPEGAGLVERPEEGSISAW
jgi:hypothetical protein